MSIKKTEQVTINGSIRCFGGVLYNIQYQPQFSEGPARVTASFVSEDGTYTEPNLSASIPYRIKVGDHLDGDFYAVEFREERGPSGKLLQVTFYDGSFVLDQKSIGLHKSHGIIPSEISDRSKPYGKPEESNKDKNEWFNTSPSNPKLDPQNKYKHYYIQRDSKNQRSNLIIIGQEFHPCDSDMDGVINFDEDGEFSLNPCDPCPTCPEDKYSEAFNRKRCQDIECTDIFEVKYNFRTLIEAAKEAFEHSKIKIKINEDSLPETNDEYYASYVGTLREVLRDWCSDYGFNFFCELNKETRELELNFVDVRTPIDIILPEDIENQPISEYTVGKSIVDTVHRPSISLFEKEGEVQIHQCEKSTLATLECLTLRDLYGGLPTSLVEHAEELNKTLLTDWETSCSLIRLSPDLRDLFWFYQIYRITNASEAMNCIYTGRDPEESPHSRRQRSLSITTSFGLGENYNKEEVQQQCASHGIPELGGMKIYAVITRDQMRYSARSATKKGEREVLNSAYTRAGSARSIYSDLVSRMNEEERSFFENTPVKVKADKNKIEIPSYDSDGNLIEGNTHVNMPGYFIIAEVDDEQLASLKKTEEELAQNFLGRYFYKYIDVSDRYKSCSGNSGDSKNRRDFNIRVDSPDGTGRCYLVGKDESFRELPFFNLGYSNSSKIGRILRKMEDRFERMERLREDPDHEPEDEEFEEALIMLERDAKWHPAQEDMESYQKLASFYAQRALRPLGDGGRIEGLEALAGRLFGADKIVQSPKLKVIACFPGSMDVDINHQESNPLDTVERAEVIVDNIDDYNGCYGDCDDNSDCFQGEQNPERRRRLEKKMRELEALGKKGCREWQALKTELEGEECINGRCRQKQCRSDEDCSNHTALVNGRWLSDKKCVNGRCVDLFGLRSNFCMTINCEGLKIHCPSQSCDRSGKDILEFVLDEDSMVNHRSTHGYDVLLTQSYSERVVIPKVQNIVQEDIEMEGDVLKYDVALNKIPYEDIHLLAGNICRPDRKIIEEAHEKFNKNLTVSVNKPFETHSFSVRGLSLASDKEVSIRNGLDSLDVSIGSSGAQATFTFSNKVAQPIRDDLNRRLIHLERKKKTSPER